MRAVPLFLVLLLSLSSLPPGALAQLPTVGPSCALLNGPTVADCKVAASVAGQQLPSEVKVTNVLPSLAEVQRDIQTGKLVGDDAELHGAIQVQGRFGQGYKAADRDRLKVNDSVYLDPVTAMSAMLWFNNSGGDAASLLDKRAGAVGGYSIDVLPGAVRADLVVNGNDAAVTAPAPPGWVHAAFTFDGSTLRLYVNGALAASTAAAGTITITRQPIWLADGADGRFSGAIDEVRIYNRALTNAEVSDIASAPYTHNGQPSIDPRDPPRFLGGEQLVLQMDADDHDQPFPGRTRDSAVAVQLILDEQFLLGSDSAYRAFAGASLNAAWLGAYVWNAGSWAVCVPQFSYADVGFLVGVFASCDGASGAARLILVTAGVGTPVAGVGWAIFLGSVIFLSVPTLPIVVVLGFLGLSPGVSPGVAIVAWGAIVGSYVDIVGVCLLMGGDVCILEWPQVSLLPILLEYGQLSLPSIQLPSTQLPTIPSATRLYTAVALWAGSFTRPGLAAIEQSVNAFPTGQLINDPDAFIAHTVHLDRFGVGYLGPGNSDGCIGHVSGGNLLGTQLVCLEVGGVRP